MYLNLISDVIKLARGNSTNNNNAGEILETFDKLKTISGGPTSIAKKAKNSIFQFPFVISNNITDMETIVHIVKSNEIEYANFILLTMGLNPMLRAEDNAQITRSLSNIHTNDPRLDITGESAMIEPEKRSLQDIMSGKKVATEAGDIIPAVPAGTGSAGSQYGNVRDHQANTQNVMQAAAITKTGMAVNKTLTQVDMQKISESIFQKYSTMYNMTIININFIVGTEKSQSIAIPLGIRGVPHLVPSDEARYLVESMLQTKKPLARFIQWKSGEIKFWRDFVLQLDILKKDVDMMNKIKTSSSWLYVLKQRKAVDVANRIKNALSSGSKAGDLKPVLPNCTLILTVEDVDLIEKSTGSNILMNVNIAKKIIDDAMLLTLVVVDTSSNVVHTLYSGETKYRIDPLSSLKGANKKDGDKVDVLLNLMKKL